MLATHAPTTLFRDSIDALLSQLPAIREGTAEGIHQGRVAIRRIRETLPIVDGHYDRQLLGSIETRLRDAARILGRARDADIARKLISHVESRFPAPVSILRELSQSVAAEQLEARRRAIKKLEALELEAIGDKLQRRRHSFAWHASPLKWRTVLRGHTVHRAKDVRSAITHAGGVYFPNRLHALRVAIKKLRYALELAKATRTRHIPRAIRVLKRAQGALGEAHDRDLLIERASTMREGAPGADALQLQQFFQAEQEAFHSTYLCCRPELVSICDACEQDTRPLTAKRSLLLASMAVPAVLLLRNTSRRRAADSEDVVERRVHITVP